MKTILKITALLLTLAGGLASCNEIEGKKLPSDQIATNLAQKGSFDQELLIGKWKPIRFAYTADGMNISDVATISNGSLRVSSIIEKDSIECEYDLKTLQWHLNYINWQRFLVSLSDYFVVNPRLCGSTMIFVGVGSKEHDLTFALANAYSFTIRGRGSELIIYFHGDEELWRDYFAIKEPKNLLILKKYEL